MAINVKLVGKSKREFMSMKDAHAYIKTEVVFISHMEFNDKDRIEILNEDMIEVGEIWFSIRIKF